MKAFSNYWKALSYAFLKYGKLTRKLADIPYVVHPVRITSILRAAGLSEFTHEDTMIAALFHDLVEDTDTTLEEIRNQFGSKVASIVEEVSKPEQGDKDEWLRSFKYASKEAKIVKMADRIDNLMDMDISSWSNEKKKSYAEQGKIILKNCGNAHAKLARELKSVIEKVLDTI